MKNIILGIHDGHNCGATLVIDGKIFSSICEERLSRKKNDTGYPKMSIDFLKNHAGIENNDISSVVYASLFMHRSSMLENKLKWYKVGIREQKRDEKEKKSKLLNKFIRRKKERIRNVVNHLKINEKKISFIEHHLCHLAAAYYTAPKYFANKKILGLTCDGAGDGLSATVSKCSSGKIKRISKTDRHASLGKIYSRITTLLGMQPWEHEYKVMGLAPYAKYENYTDILKVFNKLLKISRNSLKFQKAGNLSTNYCMKYLNEKLAYKRFDNISGALQFFTERMLITWVKNCIKKTKLNYLVCGGGVFMNVKANMLIANLPEVKRIYVMPSAADESLSIGAALHKYYEVSKNKKHEKSSINNLYFGKDFDRKSELKAIRKLIKNKKFIIFDGEKINLNKKIANLLFNNKVIARSAGRAEWGARALGNRSILARADDVNNIQKINNMIKKRDFWMPFSPLILKEDFKKYFKDPKKINPKFMTFAFKTASKNLKHLVAASHSNDQTIRPQIISKEDNKSFYEILKNYKKLSGMSVLLNTSFNLHGYPIVNSPFDAVNVFLNSGIDGLALNNFIVLRKQV